MAQVSIFSTDPAAENLTDGLPYLLSQGGEWRRLDLRDYGFARTYGGAALSPDGRHIALNDIGRQTMAVVELATGNVVRHQIPAREAITLKWSPDGRHLSFSDRHREQAPGWTLNTIPGTVVETPYRVWWSEHDAVGNIWELTANGSLRRWRDGQIAATARLDYPDLGRAYPLAAGRLFAVSPSSIPLPVTWSGSSASGREPGGHGRYVGWTPTRSCLPTARAAAFGHGRLGPDVQRLSLGSNPAGSTSDFAERRPLATPRGNGGHVARLREHPHLTRTRAYRRASIRRYPHQREPRGIAMNGCRLLRHSPQENPGIRQRGFGV